MSEKHDNDGLVSPGSTATGSGTSMGESPENDGLADAVEELGTTEGDVSDGREQKQPRMD